MQQLANGVSRYAIAIDFLYSSEANSLAINGYYLTALNRQGSVADIQSWLQLVTGGLPLGSVAQAFLSSEEYARDAAGVDDVKRARFTRNLVALDLAPGLKVVHGRARVEVATFAQETSRRMLVLKYVVAYAVTAPPRGML